jgi:hypothetical protein
VSSVAVIVPCHNEAGYVDRLLQEMTAQLDGHRGWRLVLVDDDSTDTTADLLHDAARRHPLSQVVSGRFGSPGGARSAGIAAACRSQAPDWLVTTDADVELAPDWADAWASSLARCHPEESIGAINGLEDQAHLFSRFANAASVNAAFGRGVMRSERQIGITNLNGVNHAVRTSAYATAGPYRQPTAPGPGGLENLAGEDWDLGLRLRLCGYGIEETSATVIDQGRRLLADVHAYVSGEAYEGAFRRVTSARPPVDISAEDLPTLSDAALRRSVRHFFLKPILAGAVALDDSTGLSPETRAAMVEWLKRWPSPSFAESRNGFILGRLERFGSVFTDTVLTELELGP